MKKVMLAFVVASIFAACNDSKSKTDSTTDSTVIKKDSMMTTPSSDSSMMMKDSMHTKMDSAK